MKTSALRILSAILFSAICGVASAQTVTLYPPVDPVTKKVSAGKAQFSFKRALAKSTVPNDWDLGFGFCRMSEPGSAANDLIDWFSLSDGLSNDRRSSIKDLGARKWGSRFKVPKLPPLPPVPEGHRRHIVFDTSGGRGQNGEPGRSGQRGQDGVSGANGGLSGVNVVDASDPHSPSRSNVIEALRKPPERLSSEPQHARVRPKGFAAKVVEGHMYLVHVKDEVNDFYVIFRVEQYKPNELCTISWQLVHPGKPVEKM